MKEEETHSPAALQPDYIYLLLEKVVIIRILKMYVSPVMCAGISPLHFEEFPSVFAQHTKHYNTLQRGVFSHLLMLILSVAQAWVMKFYKLCKLT